MQNQILYFRENYAHFILVIFKISLFILQKQVLVPHWSILVLQVPERI
jgi:hypothetical protein